MRKFRFGITYWLAALSLVFVAGCGQETVSIPGVVSVTPAQGATGVAINTTVTATFSIPMSPASITTSTFTLTGPGGTAVAGTVTYSGLIATFTPTAALGYGTTYAATITTGAQTPGGAGLVSNYVWTFTTIAAVPPVVPVVGPVTPTAFLQNVAVSPVINATFSVPMSSSVDTAFTVAGPGDVAVVGTVTLNASGTIATFAPAAPLAYSTTYTATITTAATGADGASLAGAYVWSFTTVAPAPLVVTTTPANGALDVPIGQVLSATFSQTMNPSTMNTTTFTLSVTGGAAVSGIVTPSGTYATFMPNAPLLNSTSYTATVTTGATSLAGIPLATSYMWKFTTITPVPNVVSTVPKNLATSVPIGQALTATFNEPMTPDTLDAASFTVTAGGVTIPGAVSYSGLVATFTPTSNLDYSTVYTATITTGVYDPQGQELPANHVWTFTTLSPALAVVSTKPLNTATGVPVDQQISATFNEPMTCPLAPGAFTVTGPGLTVVTGTIGCSGSTVTFSPTSFLAPNALFTATFNSATTDTAGTVLSSPPYAWTFLTLAAPTQPTVIVTDPNNLATGVPINQAVTATFSEAMDPATINSATFTLIVTGGATVNGVITYVPNGSIATFTPDSPLAYDTPYTATINMGALDLNDDAAVVPYTWTFTTASAPAPIVPTVISTIPVTPNPPTVLEDTNVPLNQTVSATFSEPMNPATINSTTFTMTATPTAGGATTPVTGLVAYAAISDQLVFLPAGGLVAGTTYAATITTGAQDLAGDPLANPYTWQFATSAVVVVTPPEVDLTNPVDLATGVVTNPLVTAAFSEAMNPLTINPATFQLTQGATLALGGTLVPATITYDATTFVATLTPTAALLPSTPYTVLVTDGATDQLGNPLGNAPLVPNPWTFTTGTVPFVPPIVLGPTISLFGGFGGGAGMTNAGDLTVINADIGTTGVSTTMTGFYDESVPAVAGVYPCSYRAGFGADYGLVTGTIITAPPSPSPGCPDEGTGPAATPGTTFYIATQAAAEALVAYNTLQCSCNPVAGTAPTGVKGTTLATNELGNLTLAPGTYTSSTFYDITAGPLTLDAKGDPNAYWIFQMGSALTVGSPGVPTATSESVNLVNGALASHVFWAVGSAATINPAGGGTFAGTIIAPAGVTVSTGGNNAPADIVTIDGRLLGLFASTTLVNTVINLP